MGKNCYLFPLRAIKEPGMNKRGNIAIGPGAASLILVFVVLGMSVLGMLSLISAKNDLKLAERSRDVAFSVYTLFAEAEEKLALLDAAGKGEKEEGEDWSSLLETDAEEDGGLLSFTLADRGRALELTARLPQGDGGHAVWTRHILRSATEEEETEDLSGEDFLEWDGEEEGDTEWN